MSLAGSHLADPCLHRDLVTAWFKACEGIRSRDMRVAAK